MVSAGYLHSSGTYLILPRGPVKKALSRDMVTSGKPSC